MPEKELPPGVTFVTGRNWWSTPDKDETARTAIPAASHPTNLLTDQENPTMPQPTPERVRHDCNFTWCDVNWDDQQDHWGMEYTTASLRSGDPHHLPSNCEPLRVGIGVAYSEGQAETPAIVVHIDGGRHDSDADAHLKIAEAVALRERLDICIRSAVEAFKHMAADVIGGM